MIPEKGGTENGSDSGMARPRQSEWNKRRILTPTIGSRWLRLLMLRRVVRRGSIVAGRRRVNRRVRKLGRGWPSSQLTRVTKTLGRGWRGSGSGESRVAETLGRGWPTRALGPRDSGRTQRSHRRRHGRKQMHPRRTRQGPGDRSTRRSTNGGKRRRHRRPRTTRIHDVTRINGKLRAKRHEFTT